MTNETNPLDTAKKNIFNSEKPFLALLPKNFDVKKFMGALWQEVQKKPDLSKCDNMIEVARDVATFGLMPGGLAGQANIIPFYSSKTKKFTAQLIIGYKGYITKFEEAGYTVETEIVTKKEVETGRFREIRGSETKIFHEPIREGIRARDNIALAYCIIKGLNTVPVVTVLSKEEIEEMAKTEKWFGSKAAGDLRKGRELQNVWVQNQRETDYGQMCIKTVIRNGSKRVNLRIANEMSAYEGQRDEAILKDITPPESKTAGAHTPPKAIEENFNQPIDIPLELTEAEKIEISKKEQEENAN